ncbi:hypothetical protein CALCODRAFT_313863 [Calocera cornea HHB12733]|uniref:MARVEL domain-containing protein n=1 Tax=Calocera cornea HHB12733 TaxID=1353952 RepID=A0A165FBE0_9BASI|nr:hypothetical protein CALCODRAFT_313863 [Calocera cornea HHB12733]
MHSFLIARYASFICIILLQLSITVFAAWAFTALPVQAADLGIVEPFLVIVGAMTAFFLPPIMLADLSLRNALPSKAWFEITWIGILWVLELAGGLRLALDANYFACQPAEVLPQVTTQGCIVPKVLLGLVWAVQFLLLFHLVGILVLTIRTPRLKHLPHPLFISIAQNPILQPSMPSFSPVMSPSPSEKPTKSSQYRNKLVRKRASEQLTLNDGDVDMGFWGNDNVDPAESLGPSMREIAAEEALGVKNPSARRRASSLPGSHGNIGHLNPPPVPPLPAHTRTATAPVLFKQRQISMPQLLAPHQVNMNLMPLPQTALLHESPTDYPDQAQPQPIHPQPYYLHPQAPLRERTYSVPIHVFTNTGLASTNTARAHDPLHGVSTSAMRSQTIPTPHPRTSGNIPPIYHVAAATTVTGTPDTQLDVQQMYRFQVPAEALEEVLPVPSFPKTLQTHTASLTDSSPARSRSRYFSRPSQPAVIPDVGRKARQTVQISAPLTSMSTFPEQAARRMSQRPCHAPKRLTIPGLLAPHPPAWPASGASRVTAGLAYPESATLIARRETEKKLNGGVRTLEEPRKAYTRPSIILGIANPTPTPSPGPPTPSIYAPSPEPILYTEARTEQAKHGGRRPRKESLKDLEEGGDLRVTGAELYARYVAERYPSAA